jgi:hypothetical protein
MSRSNAQKLAKKANRLRKRQIALANHDQRDNGISFQDLDDFSAVLRKAEQEAIARVIAGISL